MWQCIPALNPISAPECVREFHLSGEAVVQMTLSSVSLVKESFTFPDLTSSCTGTVVYSIYYRTYIYIYIWTVLSIIYTTLCRCKSELQQNQTSLVPKIRPVCVCVCGRSPPGCCIPTSLTGRAPDALVVWPHWQPINTQCQWVFFWCLVVYKYRASALPLHTTFLENGSTEVKINDAELPVLASLTVEPFKDNEAICS